MDNKWFLKWFGNDKDPTAAESTQKVNKAVIFVGLFAAAGTLLYMLGDDKNTEKKDIGDFKLVEEDQMAKTKWVGDAAIDVKMAKKDVEEVSKQNESLQKDVADMKKLIEDIKNQKAEEDKKADEKQPGGFPFMQGGDKAPQDQKQQGDQKGDNLYQSYPKPGGSAPFGLVPEVEHRSITKYSRLEGSLDYKEIQKRSEPEKKSSAKDRKIISTGAITKVVLLSGIDAPTMTAAKTSPLPVLMKVVDNSILPNRWKYDINECFIVGEGYGDLTAERAYIRTNTISCVTNKGKHIDMPFKGAVSGEDGKLGLRGEVVTKQGALLARTLTAGFLEGVGNAFTQQNSVVLTGTTGTTTTQSDTSPEKLLQSGAFGGLGKSAERLADFYMKMADQVAPVIEVSVGRVVNIITTSTTELQFTEDGAPTSQADEQPKQNKPQKDQNND